jgi:hypothetical protein
VVIHFVRYFERGDSAVASSNDLHMKRSFSLAGAVALIALCGCAGLPANSTSASGLTAGVQRHVGQPNVQPDKCARIRSVPLHPDGGEIVLPDCDGTEGTLTYGPNDAGKDRFFQVESYHVNPDPKDCGIERGEKSWLFETVYLSVERATFKDAKHQSVFSNQKFSSSSTFTLYEKAQGERHEWKLGSPNQDKKLIFTSPFNGRTLPGQLNICFELASP